MKRGIALIGGLLALLAGFGSAWAGGAGAVGSAAVPVAGPADFVFAAPKNASNLGGTKPAVLGAASDGTAHLPFAGTDNAHLIVSENQVFYGDFANLTLDLSPDLVGSERIVSDSQGRLHLAWFHNNSDGTTQIEYGRRLPGGAWQVRTVPGSLTGPATGGGFKVVGIARGVGDRIYVMWARNFVGARLAFTDDGVNWSPVDSLPGPVSGTATDFNVGATTSGYVFVGWFERESTDILVQMKPPGGAWGPVTDVSHRPIKGQDYTPRFATAPDGGLRLVWTGIANPNVAENDGFYREWTPGAGWSPTIVQLWNTPGNGNSQALEIVTDSVGVNHIVWDDDTARNAQNVTTYYLRGRPGSFTAPQAVVPQFGQATSRYPYVDVGPAPARQPVAHVATNSNVAGGFDNYYTWTDAGLTPPSPTPIPPSPTPCTANVYSDVLPSSPFYPFIHDLSVRNAISGYGDCTFRPFNNITRGQIAKVIIVADSYPLVSPANPDFADVLPASAFYPFVETAFQHGIISGYSCGGPGEPCNPAHQPYFRPYANVTRGQLSKMVVLGRQWTLLSPPSPDFADVALSAPFYTFVETASAHGIVSGYACGGPGEPCDPSQRPYFRPYNPATRAQAAKIIDLAIGSGNITPTP